MTPYVLVGAGLLIIFVFWRDRRRANAMRLLAGQEGLHYLGGALPESFPLQGTLEDVTKVWNVLDGQLNGVRTMVFDCAMGTGRSAWRRTVIAAECEKDPFAAARYDVNLSVERYDNWVILFRPRAFSFITDELMAVTEIEAHLKAIAA